MPRLAGPDVILALACACGCVPDVPGPGDAGESTTAQPECQTNADCSSVCADGHCVECATDLDCLNPTPICVGEICQGCSLPGQCPESAPVCENDACVSCSDDLQCQELGDDICVDAPSPDAGTCSGCSSNADCPPQYPECVAMQCTVACEADAWEGFEPHILEDHFEGGAIEGFVCQSDTVDIFKLAITGPAFVSLVLYADTKPGNVDMALTDDGNVVVAESAAESGLDVIHVHVLAGGDYHVRVSLQSGPAGAPFKLSYRTLLQ
jgi:hypothetical protein